MAFDPKVAFIAIGFLFFIGLVVGLVVYFTQKAPVSPVTAQAPARAPSQAPVPPPYTSSQDALANKFFCNGPCIS